MIPTTQSKFMQHTRTCMHNNKLNPALPSRVDAHLNPSQPKRQIIWISLITYLLPILPPSSIILPSLPLLLHPFLSQPSHPSSIIHHCFVQFIPTTIHSSSFHHPTLLSPLSDSRHHLTFRPRCGQTTPSQSHQLLSFDRSSHPRTAR